MTFPLAFLIIIKNQHRSRRAAAIRVTVRVVGIEHTGIRSVAPVTTTIEPRKKLERVKKFFTDKSPRATL